MLVKREKLVLATSSIRNFSWCFMGVLGKRNKKWVRPSNKHWARYTFVGTVTSSASWVVYNRRNLFSPHFSSEKLKIKGSAEVVFPVLVGDILLMCSSCCVYLCPNTSLENNTIHIELGPILIDSI